MIGKKIAITGSTGGLGQELCLKLATSGCELILLDRNQSKAAALEERLRRINPQINITKIPLELEDFGAVKVASESLRELSPDVFIINAGAYSIPRHKCSTGYDNIFQINFVSPYYIVRSLLEVNPKMRLVTVGSIAHTYSVIDRNDIDFSTRKGSALAYGNSKRFLMLALHNLLKEKPDALSVVHPGITFTNITAHYPKVIFAIIKHPMKLIFMKPQKAVECIFEGLFTSTPFGFWIGPKVFDIWGKPKLKKLPLCYHRDSLLVPQIADEIYENLKT